MLTRCITALLIVAAVRVPAWTQTSNATLINLQTQGRNVDFSTFSFTRPVATGASLPSTCQVGQMFFNSAAAAGSNLYACTASNVWTPQGASSGSVSSVAWGTLPTWLTGTVANGTSAPSLTLSAASGQTAHQVLGTSTGSSFVPISLTAADLPSSITSNTSGTATNVTGTVAVTNGGTGQTTAAAAFNALSPLTTLGDMLYAAASGVDSRLAGNTSTSKKFLTQTGTGSASAAPSWGTIISSDLPASITSSTTGNAASATQLASTPTACASGLYATSITAMGNANCAQVSYSQLSGAPSLYNQTIQVNGTPQTQTTALNFAAGSNVTLSSSATGGITTLTINAASSSNGVSSVAWGTLPTWLTGTVANGTSTPSLTLNTASGQTAHQVLGTGAGSSFAPISLTAADLPSSIASNTSGTAANVTGTVGVANGGTGQTTASAAFNALSPLTTLGDTLYAAASGVDSRLAGNTTTTKKFLTQTGTGSASAAPAWGTIVSGDLPASISSSTTGNAATATQLATTPTACTSGLYATSITAMGNANCAQVSYSQLSGAPSLYNQTIQVNGTPQTQTTALNFAAGSNVTLSGSATGGITTLTINASGSPNGVSGPGTSSNYALPFWNGTSGSALGNSQVTTDAAGDVTTNGAVTASTLTSSGNGAGTVMLSQGSPQSAFAANSVSIYAPASIGSAYQWVLPSNDGAGAIVSDGNGIPGHLSIAKVPQEAYSTPSGVVSTSISSTTMYTPTANGLFRFNFYLTQINAGAGCGSAGISSISVSFTDAVTGNSASDNLYLYSGTPSTGAGATNNFVTSGTPGAANRFSGQSRVFYAQAGNAISFSVAFASSGCTTQPQYEIFPILEAM